MPKVTMDYTIHFIYLKRLKQIYKKIKIFNIGIDEPFLSETMDTIHRFKPINFDQGTISIDVWLFLKSTFSTRYILCSSFVKNAAVYMLITWVD